MERLEKFVYLPDLTILRGIKVDKNTKNHFEKELKQPEQKVTQDLENLQLKTKIVTVQDNNVITSEVVTYLAEGDILLFEENYGFVQSAMKVGTVDDALETKKKKKSVIERSEKEYKEGNVYEFKTK